MTKKTYLIVAILMLFLTGCNWFSKDYIMETIEINSENCTIESDKDTHGSFHGDGDYFAKIVCPEINYDELSSNWKELPLSTPINDVTHMNQCNIDGCRNFYKKYSVPDIENGYYYFLDRHSESTDKHDDTDLNNRASWNFTVALLDKDTNIIYYYEFDT